MSGLNGRIALVTGGGRGIGRAIALALAEAGAHVAVSARSAAELDEVVGKINAARTADAAGGKGAAFVADIAQPAAARELVQQVTETLGPVDILVNNAGVGSSANPKPVVDFDDDFWDLTLNVNLNAPYRLCKAVLPHMLAQKWGRIITVASINGRIGSFHGAAYAASKHGVLGLMRTLAMEVAPQGITVNSICPGPVKTVMNDRRIEYDAQRRGVNLAEHEAALTPIGGRLEPEDIAPMAVYLASEGARMVTGQSFNIDGGIVMS